MRPNRDVFPRQLSEQTLFRTLLTPLLLAATVVAGLVSVASAESQKSEFDEKKGYIEELPIRYCHSALIDVAIGDELTVMASIEDWKKGEPVEKLVFEKKGESKPIELKDVIVDFSTEGRLVIIGEELRHAFMDQAKKGEHSIIVIFGSHRGGHRGGGGGGGGGGN